MYLPISPRTNLFPPRYVVRCTKHMFPEHTVFQFNVVNTLEDQVLDNVTFAMESDDPDCWQEEHVVPSGPIRCGEEPGTIYVCMRRVPQEDEDGDVDPYPTGSFGCEMKFLVKDVLDPSTGEYDPDGYEEEYPVEDVEVATSDFMARVQVRREDRDERETRRAGEERRDRYNIAVYFLPYHISHVVIRLVTYIDLPIGI